MTWPHFHTESVGPGRSLSLKMREGWLFEGEESFPALGATQRVQIGDFEELGRGLVLDGALQLAERSDSLYTTALVFPAALRAGSRASWFIVGGGDGAAAREALRFRDTRSVVLVDISKMTIEQTQRLIPSFWAGYQSDPRLQIEIADAGRVLREHAATGAASDIIVFDLTDPSGEEPTPGAGSSAEHLYTKEVFALAARALRPGGVFVAQLGELSLLRWRGHKRLVEALRQCFRHAVSYRTFVESFGCWESFVIASNDAGAWSPAPPRGVESLLADLYQGDGASVWSARWHEHLFSLPPALDLALQPRGAGQERQ